MKRLKIGDVVRVSGGPLHGRELTVRETAGRFSGLPNVWIGVDIDGRYDVMLRRYMTFVRRPRRSSAGRQKVPSDA